MTLKSEAPGGPPRGILSFDANRLRRTQSLFLVGGSFVLHSLAITRRERSNQGAYSHIERGEA